MAGSRSREARRRRVLNEEARAIATPPAGYTVAAGDDEAPRYGEQAQIENHPQITDYVPRRRGVTVAVFAGIVAVAAACHALTHFAPSLAAAAPQFSLDAVGAQAADGIAAWTSAVALLIAAAGARIIYSLRRHRVDDQHGRYRVWRWAALAAAACSVDSVVGLHDVLGPTLRAVTGWSLTASGAEWWLLPLAAVGAPVSWALCRETAESRIAAAFAMLAGGCYFAAAVGALGWAPAQLGVESGLLSRTVALTGHAAALAAIALFARHVVLDVQGLIDHPQRALRIAAETSSSVEAHDETSVAPLQPPAAPSPVAPSTSEWIDGSEPEADDLYDQPRRKLSKAERKRLRKQKMRNKAA